MARVVEMASSKEDKVAKVVEKENAAEDEVVRMETKVETKGNETKVSNRYQNNIKRKRSSDVDDVNLSMEINEEASSEEEEIEWDIEDLDKTEVNNVKTKSESETKKDIKKLRSNHRGQAYHPTEVAMNGRRRMADGFYRHHCQEGGCQKKFSSRGHLNDHMRKSHGDEKLRCTRCASQFCSTVGLRRHMRSHHKEAEGGGEVKEGGKEVEVGGGVKEGGEEVEGGGEETRGEDDDFEDERFGGKDDSDISWTE